MDLIESTLVSAVMEDDEAEVVSSYEKTWEATAKVLGPTHPARFQVCERVLLPSEIPCSY